MASDCQGLCNDLESGMQRKQLQALRALQKSGVVLEAEATVMGAIINCMTAAQADVRAMAVKTFGSLAQRGDQKCIDLVNERLADDHWSVRRAAVESLGRIAVRGDLDAMTAVGAMIRDSHSEVRTVALDVFASLADRGDTQQALAALKGCLEDWNPEVRRAAVLGLGVLARPRYTLFTRRSTSSMFINKEQLSQQTPRQAMGEPQSLMEAVVVMDILPAIIAQLSDAHPEVRKTAAEVLGRCSPKSDSEAVAQLRVCLKDRVWQVRKAAVEALSLLEEDEQRNLSTTVGAMTKDSHASVRKAASEVLARQPTRSFSTPSIQCCCFFRHDTDDGLRSREPTWGHRAS